jgi:FkbM family methyltransferase
MKRKIKYLVKSIMSFISSTKVGSYINEIIIEDVMNRTVSVSHQGTHLKFSTPNWITRWRAETFSEKEPETLEWINKIPKGSVLWDIGANVGIYSCYAAKRGVGVFAFEPSVFNLEILSRNIFLNKLTEQVTIVPLPLTEKLTFSTLNMVSTDWGGALSTFGKEYGQDGEPMNIAFKLPTIGLSMVDAINLLNIHHPDYIKMDVDGIEHLILQGGLRILDEVKGLLVEINDNFFEQSENSNLILKEAGFSLIEKRHEDTFSSGPSKYIFNQMWCRKKVDEQIK